jgi:quinol monooxygenase YgiN
MPYILIRHKVNDYDAWKPVYDEDADNRKAHGCTSAQVFRNANNPNEVVALFAFHDMERAQQFSESPELRERMQRAGVADHPDLFFLDEAERSAY